MNLCPIPDPWKTMVLNECETDLDLNPFFNTLPYIPHP